MTSELSPVRKRRIKDSEEQKNPALRISHIAYGRERRGSRVVYLVDPAGAGEVKKIAEQVVLHRWRRRTFPGHSFAGGRLNPGLWRTAQDVFGGDPATWVTLSELKIQYKVDTCRESLRKRHETLPSAQALRALFEYCGPTRLQAILARHTDPERRNRFGTPDLFLYAINNESKKVSIARFVEVKRPEEQLSQDQKEEIRFLQSLDLHARVLRLIER
jgi:hypothetical protein